MDMQQPANLRISVLAHARVCAVVARLSATLGLQPETHDDVQRLLDWIVQDCGVLVLGDQITGSAEPMRILQSALERQPDWSEIPVIVLTRPDFTQGQLAQLRALRGATLLERPLSRRRLERALRIAISARQRQLHVRGELEALRHANEELRTSVHEKDALILTLAHELRSPLSAVLGAARVLRSSSPQADLAERMASLIQRQGLQMKRLLDDVMDASRIASGRVSLRRGSHALSRLLATALETIDAEVKRKGHSVSLSLPTPEIWLNVDGSRMVQVLVNVLANAVKYTPPGGIITIRAHQDSGTAIVCIRDNGIGIPAAALSRIFGMFVQVSAGSPYSEGGLGIGLCLARGLIELHGGRIIASSAGPGQGSEFELHIPAAEPVPAVAEAPSARP